MLITMALAFLVTGADPPPASAKAVDALLELHQREAARWKMYLGDDQSAEAADFRDKPIYVWTNPTRGGGQHGAVFVWLQGGRPVVIGSTFSHPENNRRMLCHEFHSVAEGELRPTRDSDGERWQPEAAVELQKLPAAPAPAETPAKRLIQMRSLAREFTAHSVDFQKERWELRLLTQPLYRYEKPTGETVDGALFAFVTSAGTDPEVVLVIEARTVSGDTAWHYRALRFSDSNLFVRHNGKDVWSSVRDAKHTLHNSADHTYRLIRDRYLDELPELVAESPQ